MTQQSLTNKRHSQFNICEWYQMEKESYALSSPKRPKQENTLQYCFRQTSFPYSLEKRN